jgi:small neutral amino acid transporter SnatA (MarC family)
MIHGQQGKGLGHLGNVLPSIGLVRALVRPTHVPASALGRWLGAASLAVVDRVGGLLLAAFAIELVATERRTFCPWCA